MKIELRPVTAELIELLPQWAQEPDLKEYFRAFPPLQEWNRPDLAAQLLQNAFGIYEDGRLIGLVQMSHPNPNAGTVELGMLIDTTRTASRKESSQLAYEQILDYLFNRLGFQKVYVRILASRDKLIHRFLQGGYKLEGKLERSAKIDGKLQDEVLLAYFKEEK